MSNELLSIYRNMKTDMNVIRNILGNRTLGPPEGRGGYSAVHIPAGPIAPIGTQWHVFYLPLFFIFINCVLKKLLKMACLLKSSIFQ